MKTNVIILSIVISLLMIFLAVILKSDVLFSAAILIACSFAYTLTFLDLVTKLSKNLRSRIRNEVSILKVHFFHF